VNHLAFDQSLNKLDMVLERKKSAPEVVRLLDQFNGRLARECAQREWYLRACISDRGIAYHAGENMVFVWLAFCRNWLSVQCFSGRGQIKGLKKANWIRGGDNRGAEMFRINDDATLDRAVGFALQAHRARREH